MDTDKVVFGFIAGFTLLIIGVIIATSLGAGAESVSADVIIGGDPHYMGIAPTNSKLTIVEFSDFECPACARYFPILKSLVKNYPDELSIVYRHFPIPGHAGAIPAARASEAAANQGKFWEYHDKLFINQGNFEEDNLLAYAQDLGVDIEKFRQDFQSQGSHNSVQEDVTLARKLKLNSTPTFYLVYNGEVEKLNLQTTPLESKVGSILDKP